MVGGTSIIYLQCRLKVRQGSFAMITNWTTTHIIPLDSSLLLTAMRTSNLIVVNIFVCTNLTILQKNTAISMKNIKQISPLLKEQENMQ
jgi:hypothetical protein